MAFIPTESLAGRLGGALGSGLAQPLNQALDALAQQKITQLHQRQYAKGLEPLLGKDTASFLATLNPEERKQAFQNLGPLMQLQGMNQQAQAPQQGGGMQALAQQPQQAQQGIMQPQGAQQEDQRAKLIQDIFTSPKEKREQLKELREQELHKIKKEEIAQKETKEYFNNVTKFEKAAKQNDVRLDKMLKAIDKGTLPNAGLWSFLTKLEDSSGLGNAGGGATLGGALGTAILPGVGTAIGAAAGGLLGSIVSPLAGAAKSAIRGTSPDIEEFEKLSADFVKNAKDFFGNRITDTDLKAYMATIPTLMQTDAGKKKVINNLKSFNDMAKLEAKVARRIIKENGGVRPRDLEQQVQDEISPQIDELVKQFLSA